MEIAEPLLTAGLSISVTVLAGSNGDIAGFRQNRNLIGMTVDPPDEQRWYKDVREPLRIIVANEEPYSQTNKL